MLLSTPLAKRGMDHLPFRKLRFPKTYTDYYVAGLYAKVARGLQKRQSLNRDKLLQNINLIIFYVDLNDGSETRLVETFGVEALVISLNVSCILQMPTGTKNQQNHVANIVLREINRAFQGTGGVIDTIFQEVTNRINKTCLLLPPKTFGREFLKIRDQVHSAARERWTGEQFQKSLRKLASSLPAREGYFIRRRSGLLFKSPGRSGMRHGLAPVWGDGSHNATCVIRGRVRFGVSFDPRFHYDCQLPNRHDRNFPGCHQPERIDRGRQHANVAPNDNVR